MSIQTVQRRRHLGSRYAGGRGVPENPERAADWFRRAAEHDMASAGYMLGLIYGSGKGLPKDLDLAAHWHRQAAEHGNHYAQQVLARLYRDGHGVPQDRVQAYKWLELAIPGLKPSAARDAWVKTRAQIGATLSAEEIAEARRLARAWTPSVR